MRAYGEANLTYAQRQDQWGGEHDAAVAGSLEKERNLSKVAHPLPARSLDDTQSDASTAVAGVAAARTAAAGAKEISGASIASALAAATPADKARAAEMVTRAKKGSLGTFGGRSGT